MRNKLEPIGVFDSGIGGLTVLKALQDKFPHESYVYIGDTARLPYGTKSPETIIRYSQTLTREILKHNVKAIVVACNTASTHALHAVQEMANVPVLGMIEPASRAAIAETKNNHIAVLATFGTIRSDIYKKTIQELNPDIRVSSQACQLLVALAEEGWADSEIAEMTIRKYIDPLFNQNDAPDTLILGCTHFPLFEELLQKILGNKVALINSGKAAADELVLSSSETENSICRFMATDDPARFAASAAKFFGRALSEDEVQLIDI